MATLRLANLEEGAGGSNVLDFTIDYFCLLLKYAHVNFICFQYYCEHCWATIHSRPGREFHKPLVKEGADRPRAVPFRWC